MITIPSLWAPIVLSAILVFFAAFLAWVVLPHHKSDWRPVGDEAGLLESLGKQRLSPGQYSFPYMRDMNEMKNPEMMKKIEKGPVGFLVVMPSGPPAMGKNMALSFVYYLVVSVVAAYLAGRLLPQGADYLAVFRVAGTVSFVAYSAAHVSNAIWFGFSWSSTIKNVVDGLVYGLLTGGAFGWLWPR
jgi:hypothetical protein